MWALPLSITKAANSFKGWSLDSPSSKVSLPFMLLTCETLRCPLKKSSPNCDKVGFQVLGFGGPGLMSLFYMGPFLPLAFGLFLSVSKPPNLMFGDPSIKHVCFMFVPDAKDNIGKSSSLHRICLVQTVLGSTWAGARRANPSVTYLV